MPFAVTISRVKGAALQIDTCRVLATIPIITLLIAFLIFAKHATLVYILHINKYKLL